MQTFLPSENIEESAKLLDNKRLHKQALEAWQILMVLTKLDPDGNDREPKGWVNHPAVKMWRGAERGLVLYAIEMAKEWKRRGFKTTLIEKIQNTFNQAVNKKRIGALAANWMEDSNIVAKVTSSHRRALLVKNYEYYSQFNWPEDPGYPPTEYEYTWPV